jgi:cytochrome b subunit of formate dehydrogenase
MSTVHDLPPLLADELDVRPSMVGDVARFGRTERFLHWWIVVMFSCALLTGVAMGDEAESGSLLRLHIGSVVLIGVGVVMALVFGDTMAVLRSARDLFLFDRTDVDAVSRALGHPGPGHGDVRWGKFNLGQKVLARSLVASLAALILTGINSGRREKEPRDPTLPPSWCVSACSLPTSSWRW